MGNLDTQVKDWGSMFGAPITTDGELAHFGVLGMKWGVRKQKESSGDGRKKKGLLKTLKDRRKGRKLRKAKKLKAKLEKKRLKKQMKYEKKMEKKLAKAMENPAKLYKYRNKFTTEQILKAVERYDAEKRLRDHQIETLNRGKRYIDLVVGYGNSIYNAYSLIGKFTGNSNKGNNDGGGEKKDKNNNNNQSNKPKKKENKDNKTSGNKELDRLIAEKKKIDNAYSVKSLKAENKRRKKELRSYKP